MTPAAIIEHAAGEGVHLTLSSAGKIKASGNERAVGRWLPIIRANRLEILTALRAADAAAPPAQGAPLEASAAARRRRVLAILAQYPELRYAVIADDHTDPDSTIVHVGIRGVASGEVVIAKARYNAGALMALLDKFAAGGPVGDSQVSKGGLNDRSTI